MLKGYDFSIQGIRKGYFFRQSWLNAGKGLTTPQGGFYSWEKTLLPILPNARSFFLEWLLYLKTTLKRFLRTEITNEVVSIPQHCPGCNLYAFFILFHATRMQSCETFFLDKNFTSITVQRRSWSHTNARFLRKSRIPLFFFHIAFPNSKQTNKAHFIVWFERWQYSKRTGPVDSHLPLKRMISGIYNIQAKTSRIPCLNFGEFRFQGSFRILFPVKIFCVFPNPAKYVGQIPDPEKTLKTLFNSHLSKLSIV